jgi:hypothetical protein
MAGGWSSLPADLLAQISALLLSDADHLHAHQVCAHWRASTSRPAAYRPWVVAGRQVPDGRGPLGEYSLLLPRSARRVDFAASPPPGLRYCCGTPRGWLALVDDLRSPTRLVLWEPHSGAEIPLPCLCPVIQVFLSGDPLSSPDWVAIATQPKGPIAHILFFWRPGDAAWSGPGRAPAATVHSIEFYAGKVYCVDSRENITIYDLKLGTTSPPVFLQATGMFITQAYREPGANRRLNCLTHSVRAVHVVACGGELLLVLLFDSRRGMFMEVYRPAWTPLWPCRVGERVTDLGGYALFLGRGDVAALSSKEYPAIKGNCIYYLKHSLNAHSLNAHRDALMKHLAIVEKMKHWAMVFDLGTDAVEHIPYPEVLHKEERWWPYSWFCPPRPLLERSSFS